MNPTNQMGLNSTDTTVLCQSPRFIGDLYAHSSITLLCVGHFCLCCCWLRVSIWTGSRSLIEFKEIHSPLSTMSTECRLLINNKKGGDQLRIIKFAKLAVLFSWVDTATGKFHNEGWPVTSHWLLRFDAPLSGADIGFGLGL